MNDSRIKFRHLECFLSVAHHRSLQKASEALAITAPAVSKTIRELEDIVQVRLFERSRNGTVLTRSAEVFFHHAEAVVTALRRATDSMTEVRMVPDAIIRIGASPTLAASFVPQVLHAFHERMTAFQVSLRTSTTDHLMTRLREREFDLVLCRHSDPEHMGELSFEYLYVDPLVIVVRTGHPLLDSAEVNFAHLRRYTTLLPIKGSINRHAADTFAIQQGIGRANDFIENLSVSFGRSYTRRSDAVWFVPWSAVQEDVTAGLLVKLALPFKTAETAAGLMGRATGLMMRTNTDLAPPIQLLINIIRETAAIRRAQLI